MTDLKRQMFFKTLLAVELFKVRIGNSYYLARSV